MVVAAVARRSMKAAAAGRNPRRRVAVLVLLNLWLLSSHHQAEMPHGGEHGMTPSLRTTLLVREVKPRRAQVVMDSEPSNTSVPMSATVMTTPQPSQNASTSESSVSTGTSVTTTLTKPQPERRPGGGQCRRDMPDLSNPVELLQNLAEIGENVICPFLGTLLKAGVLPLVCVLHRSQLLDITVRAGLPFAQAMAHIESNFRNIPGGFIDICCMEGSTAEHLFSTGINDCKTTYLNCSRDGHGVLSCADVQTEMCSLPNRNRFNDFFTMLDTDLDGNITRSELGALVETDSSNDATPGGEGTIRGSFGLLMDVFGHVNATGQPDSFDRATLEQVLLKREFPPHYNPMALRWPLS